MPIHDAKHEFLPEFQGPEVSLLAVAVGNTRTRFGMFNGKDLQDPTSLPNSDSSAIVDAIVKASESTHGAPIVIASVNAAVADQLERALTDAQGETVYRIGRDVAIPMSHTLSDASTLGQDRLLCAFGAYQRAGQACVVVDAGTAITVDFVDGEGVYHGGIIAPGLNMMLAALHEHTAALPKLVYSPPAEDLGPFGKDTRHAMLLGVRSAAQGLVRLTAERYAEHYEAYPQIVATGGDAPALFQDDPVVEHIVPDLQLIGIREACVAALTSNDEDDDPDDQ